MIDLAAVRDAERLLAAHFATPTRMLQAPGLTRVLGRPVHLKLETDLPTGSFKPRGALYALSVRRDRSAVREVVASSTGNHGAAVAYAARAFGVPATIFLPLDPNPVKRARIAELGARIVEGGRDSDAAFQAASQSAKREGVYFLNDATDPDLPAGPGTIAVELLAQVSDARAVVVPVGDTALIRGIAAVIRQLQPRVRVIGVQAERAPAYTLSWRAGRVVTTESCDTIADGLATRTPEADNVTAVRELVDDFVLVSEEQLLGAIRHLLIEEHVVAEPAGAAACAAVLKGVELPDGPVVLLVTGANLTPEILRRAATQNA